MLDAAMCESTELVAMTPCASNYAASAKGMALDCVRGKTAMLRLMLSLLDDLDHIPTDGRQRRGFDRRLEEMEAADEAAAAFANEQETNGSVHPVSQGVIEEERLPTWDELARETPGSPTAAPPLSEGIGQSRRAESERSFLAVARRVPSEKELREQENQAEIERSRKAYEQAVAHVKAFAAKRGYAFRESQCSNSPENAPSPLSEGKSEGIIRYYGANAPRNLTACALPWRHDRPCHIGAPQEASGDRRPSP